MKFGIHLPNFSILDGREPTLTVARQAEQSGFDSLWVSDHVVLPSQIESRYPYSRTGAFPMGGETNFVDPLIALAVAAGCTERVELGITVLIVPQRNPILTAKMLSSLDMLSNGRVIVAAGVGWLREEFEALGLPYFEQRGRVMDEWIRIFRLCWEEDLPSFVGEHYRFAPLYFRPKPVHRIPIWIGGRSAAAYRRAALVGDGWHPARATLSEVRDGIARVRREAERGGRDPDTLIFSMGCVVDVLDEAENPPPPTRDLIGAPAAVAEFVRALEALGVSHLALDFRAGSSLHAMLATMERFNSRVRPLLA